jgi:hypothetical protein
MSHIVQRAAVLALALAFAGCFGAMQSTPDDPIAVGDMTPKIEDKDAGLVALASGFDVKAYPTIVVTAFPVTDTAIKDDDDRRLAAEMSTFLQSELVRRLRETGLFKRVVNATENPDFRPAAGEKTLRVDGVITRLGQGSQVARAFFGLYGAGRARAQAETRFVDLESTKVMLATADRRIAQVGMWGGASRDHLRESFDDIARDVGRFLVRLSKGDAPQKPQK